MKRIVVIRFSALGDVAMVIPVIASIMEQYPQNEVIVVTKKGFGCLFSLLNGNIKIIEADFRGKHTGLKGIFRLFSEIKLLKPDYIADLHSVLRTHVMSLLFLVRGIKIRLINKGRNEKAKLTRRENKVFEPLPSNFERYRDVFTRLGFDISIKNNEKLSFDKALIFAETEGSEGKIIGIAPFAKHNTKTYPSEKMEQVIRMLYENFRIILFGGGENEIIALNELEQKYKNVISVAGKYTLDQEIQLISKLSVMLTMDSANMHLAALTGIPVLSVWGATHSYAGFSAWNQPESNKIEIDLDCRPCSVYGNKPCWRGDFACMNGIAPETIVEKLKSSAR